MKTFLMLCILLFSINLYGSKYSSAEDYILVKDANKDYYLIQGDNNIKIYNIKKELEVISNDIHILQQELKDIEKIISIKNYLFLLIAIICLVVVGSSITYSLIEYKIRSGKK